MYGVRADFDLAFLHDAELIQVCLGEYQIQFHFHPDGHIYVEGKWELRNAAGELIDGLHEGPLRPPCLLHRLLGFSVVETKLSPPNWLALRFETGDELRLIDDSSKYESFRIEPGGIVV